MTTITHAYCGATIVAAPLVALGADANMVFWALFVYAALWGASPDLIGEWLKWHVGIAGKLTDDLVFTIVRRGADWSGHDWAHDVAASCYAFYRKYWYLGGAFAMLHVKLDTYVHAPTGLINKDEHPILYWAVWVVLECLVILSITMLWVLARWLSSR